jgi:hypothetical protein
MKKFGLSLLSLLLLTSVGNIASAAGNDQIKVLVNGVQQHFDQSPILYHDYTLVPLRGIFENLGAKVTWDQATQKVTVNKDMLNLTLQIGKDTVIKNGLPIELPVTPEVVNGRTLVPLRFISETLGAKVDWLGDTNTVVITSDNNNTSTSSNTSNQNSSSAQITDGTLSYDQAYNLSLGASQTLKIDNANIDQSRDALKAASDNVDYIPSNGGSKTASDAFTTWTQQQTKYQMSQKQIDMDKDKLAYKVKKAYNTALSLENAKQIADLNEQDQEWQLKIINVKKQNGLASDYDVNTANNTLVELKEKQDAAQKSLDDAYRSLNVLLGYNADQKYTLTDKPTFSELKDDVDTKVNQVVSSSTAVWLAEQNVNLAKLDLDLYTFNVKGSPSYDSVGLNVDKAKFSEEDTKTQLESTVRGTYTSIKTLETNYHQLQATLAKAQDSLKVTQTKYDIGMATDLDLFEAKLAVEKLNQQIFDIVVNLDSLKMGYDKPWATAAN